MKEITEIEGEKISIVLTSSSSPSDIGSFNILDHSRIRFTATASGPFAAIAIYQDRRAPKTGNNVVSGKSSGGGPGPEIRVDGTIYAPAQELRLDGDGRIRVEPDKDCASIVANNFKVQQDARIRLKCDDDSKMSGGSNSMVRLVK